MSNVELSSPAPQVTQITLNRPDKLNALTYDLVRDLYEAIAQIDADHDCRAVVLTGAGRGLDRKSTRLNSSH